MTPFETLLSDPYAARHYLVELQPYDPATGGELSLYYSDHGFTVGAEGGSLDHQHFEARVVEALNFQRSMFRPEAVGGSSIPSFGEIQLANGDGALDFMRDLAFDGRSVVVRLGGEGFSYGDFGVVFSGTAQSATVDEEKVTVRLRDLQYKLQAPVQTVLYEAPPGDAMDLAFSFAVTPDNDYYYAAIGGVAAYTLQAGDYLEYEVYWSLEGPQDQKIGVDLITDLGALRASGAVDQNGLGVHPSTDLRPFAEGAWYPRQIEIPAGLIGGQISAYLVACEYEASSTPGGLSYKSLLRGAIRDMVLTDGAGTERFSVWKGSDPLPSLSSYLTSNAANGVTVERLLNLEGDPNLEGKPKPLCFGRCLNVTPVLVSPNLLTYQVHGGGPIAAIDAVYDKGVALVGPAGPGSPQYSVDLERGTFTLNQQPIGEITADVQGDATDEVFAETVATVIARLVTTYGPFETTDLETATFDALDLEAPFPVGLYISGERTILDVLDELINSVGGFYGFNRAGLLCVGRFEAPDPLSAVVLDGVDGYVAVDGLFYDQSDYVEMTVEAWVRTAETTSQFLASWDRSEYWRLGIGTSVTPGTLSFNFREGKSQTIMDLAANTVINDDRWHHVAVVFDNGELRFFVDGEADGSFSVGSSFGRGEGVVRYGFWGIGSEAFGFDGATNPGTNAKCRISEGRIWDVARDESDFKTDRLRRLAGNEPGLVGYWRFDEGSGTTAYDSSIHGNHGYFRGGASWNSVLTVGPGEILGIENVPVELPLWRQRVSYQRNWTVMTADAIAGAVTDERRNFLTEELRLVTVKDETVKDVHLLARDPEATRTLLLEETAAEQEAQRLFDLYRQQRSLYRVTVKTQPFKLELGDQVQVVYPRLGLDGGRVFRVIGLEERAEINRVTLELWG